MKNQMKRQCFIWFFLIILLLSIFKKIHYSHRHRHKTSEKQRLTQCIYITCEICVFDKAVHSPTTEIHKEISYKKFKIL